jgi:protein pelota
LIVSSFNPKHGQCSLTLESADDLWTLRRVLRAGDVVVTRSSRILKQQSEYARPDKGERIKITIALRVEGAHLDSSIERLRVRGTIIEASDESVMRTGSHSVSLTPGRSLTIRKDRWSRVDIGLIDSTKGSTRRFVLVAVDRREAGIGMLSGSHLAVLTTIESGLGGKMSAEQSPGPFLARVAGFVKQVSMKGDVVVVAGPGHVKNSVANQLRAELKGSATIQLVEGFDLSGADGVRALVKFSGFQDVAKDSELVEMQKLVNEIIRRISRSDPRIAYTLPRVKEASMAGSVDACAVSNDVFSSNIDEAELVETLNAIEERGGRVYLADSSLELGKQISSFGGIVALLRYALTAY